MSETHFYAVPVLDYDCLPLHLTHVMAIFLPTQDAVNRFYEKYLKTYQHNYTAGYYGQTDHEWAFSHHEVYEPADNSLPSLVLLRYKPIVASITDITAMNIPAPVSTCMSVFMQEKPAMGHKC